MLLLPAHFPLRACHTNMVPGVPTYLPPAPLFTLLLLRAEPKTDEQRTSPSVHEQQHRVAGLDATKCTVIRISVINRMSSAAHPGFTDDISSLQSSPRITE